MNFICADELKKLQFEILIHVSEFCKQEKITYFLAYGTLLGSVRHQGYIPWDDDIDIAMPRPDYDRFIRIFNKRFANLQVLSFENDSMFPFTFAKVINTETVLIENSAIEYLLGINIDVFPIDGLPSNDTEINRHYSKIRLYRSMLDIKNVKINKTRKIYKNLTLVLGKVGLIFIPYRYIIGRIIDISKKYKYHNSDKVGIQVLGYGIREVSSAKDFEYTLVSKYEGYNFDIPNGYDNWLKTIYGDYMQFPPVENRISKHEFNAYWKD